LLEVLVATLIMALAVVGVRWHALAGREIEKPGALERVIRVLVHGKLRPKQIISHRMPLTAAAEGYELFDSKEALKVVLDPRG